uniref:FAT atypical cadherin 3b n=1 Tax=Pygocentrus nattereri TaxID=42514 RepID=A0AAR2KH39_PYGNA
MFPGGSMRTCPIFTLVLFHLLSCWGQLQEPGSSVFQFTSSVYNASIYENSAARSYLRSEVKMGIVLPQSSSWDIKYFIESGDDEGLFQAEEYVLGDFCFLRIRTNGGSSAILNREVQDNYTLSVRALDRDGQEASARVSVQIMDMNDLRPLFSPTTYTITVAESTPLGASVAQVTATDADIGSNGEFYYFFRKVVEHFAVHPTSGVISLTAKPNADEIKRFDLEVLAVDRGTKVYGNNGVISTAKLMISIIRVNEYSPALNAVALVPSLSDKEPVFAVVMVEDLDEGPNGEIEWVAIIAGDPLEQFVLDRAALGNEYRLKTSEPVDWNTFPYGCNLTFQAKDRGTPPKFSNTQVLQLLVKKPPSVLAKFEKDIYRATISEIAPPGTIIQTVGIAPKPRSVSYGLSLTSDSFYFSINTFTGAISTARQLTMLGQQLFELEVTEAMSGLRAKVLISVEDSNDNIPTFTQASYEVFVNESAPVGTVILVVSAMDDDRGENGCITYSIASLQALPFTINQNTGELKTSKELDFESFLETYVFPVRASDWGLPYRRENEVNVTVRILNVNDNPPLFERVSCKGMIARDFSVGQTIITMSAIDIDELGLVKYQILSGNEQDLFSLNPDSGMLSLRRSLVGANVKNGVFSLKIAATDGEIFSEPTFVNVSVVRGRMSSKSFNCKDTKVAQKLAEKLLKKANAMGKSKVEEVFTDLYSVNRQTPQFEAFPSDIVVREDSPVGSTVIKVNTNDGDTGFNGRILHVISNGNTDSCFNIDMESGVIYIYQPLDRERSDRYLLNVTIYDMGLPQRSNWRLLTVNVDDVNDNSPQFSLESYTVVVPENTAIGTEVIEITATDLDLGQNGEISYSLITGTLLFGINSATGWVYVSGQLDRESMPDITLKIEARDKAERGNQKFSVTTLKIYLGDVNDCPPKFIPQTYSCRVLEDLPAGTVITWLQTQDPDFGSGGRVMYYLADDFNGTFVLNVESGAVKVAKELDFEKQQFYNLSVVAEDCGLPVQLRSSSYVEVEVVDVNENLNEPYFSEFAVKATIKENSRLGTSVVQVTAKDDDKGRDGVIRYSIKAGSGLGRFSIDEETGTCLIIPISPDCLCFEMSLSVQVTVTDGSDASRQSTVWVIVHIQDENDNKPEFPETVYRISLPERDRNKRGDPVYRVFAYDRDEGPNAELTYSIVEGNDDGKFFIDTKTAMVFSRKMVTAGGYDILTVRDQRVYVKMLLPPCPKFGRSAERCLMCNTGGTFGIDSLSGIVSVARELDFTSVGHYILTVRATDGGTPALSATVTARIIVSLSDFSSPKFTQMEYQAEITENVPIGTFVTNVSAVSRSALIYEISQGNIERKFRVNGFTGVITTQKSLDFEATASYVLVIQAVNMAGIVSSATVNIQVVDENDNPPAFKQLRYSGSISEAAPVNSVVLGEDGSPLVIQAIDADRNQNALLVFEIVEDMAKLFFTVDSGTGSVRTIASLDYETFSGFYFRVNVRDSGTPQLTAESPAEVVVKVVNINDSPPKFSQDAYDAVLMLPTYVGVEALRVEASDPDMTLSIDLIYSLADNNLELFAIEPTSGILTVKNNKLSQDRYRFSVKVSDGRYSSTAFVTVLVREAMDSGLLFSQPSYSSSVLENTSNISAVTVVNAIGNRLNEPLKYTLLNAGTRFNIQPTSGVIKTTGIPFDREEQEFYELVVEVSREYDRLRVARVTVRVQVEDVNDNAPEFVGLPYYAAVQVDAHPGSSIFQVSATDLDRGINGKISYELKEEHRHFEINRVTGELTLKRAFVADLSNVEYPVVILARDAGYPSLFTAVELPVTVVNKAMPVFDKPFYGISVREDIAVSTPILSINATSPEGQNIIYTIVDGDSSLNFDIGFDSGVISVICPLDYETISYYRLTVRSTDTLTGARSEVDVDIVVVDVNDNAPVFEKASYLSTLAENSMIGTAVVQLLTTDKDSEKNGVVRYQILSDAFNSTDYFHIDSSSGVVLTARLLDYELIQSYNFIVRATDSGSPAQSSEVMVTVLVNDTNDNPPAFNQPLYEAFISELAPRGHFVTCVQASDADSSDTDRLKYSILSGDDRMNFVIDSQTGVISLSNQRRQGIRPAYILNVSVSDGVFTSTAQVNIRILGANLYSPVFSQRFYLAEVRENAPAGTKVIQVRATDEDSGLFGQIMYSFINDLGKTQFSIGVDGVITTAQKLDRENPVNRDIVLTVMALDGGGRASFCTVRVMLIDENDNAPRFRAVEYRVSIKANIAMGSLVTQIQAQDPDAGDNGRVSYSLYSEARLPLVDVLEIEPDSGWMVTKGSMAHLRGTVLSFFVKATDGGVPAKHSLVSAFIHVLPPDANIPTFTQPQYSFTVPEDTPVGTALGSVYLGPGQTGAFAVVNGETVASNQGGTFLVERETGLLRLVNALDYEQVSIYRFKVSATMRQALVESMSVVDVEVKVLDVNDNKPSFETSSYIAMVMEGMPVGTRVVQVRALDPDWGSNGQVTYNLGPTLNQEKDQTSGRASATGSMFAIDSKTGWITTLGDLDHEICPSYTFSVVASDLGEVVSLSSTAVVTVAIADVNDNPPTFERGYYRGAVRESDPIGEVVSVLSTRDWDTSDQNRLVSFHITGGNPKGVFALAPVQGEWKVFVKQPLDREEQDRYLLNITASDGLFVSRVIVEVTVMDANDNSPICNQALYEASFPEDVLINSGILTVGAVDFDLGSNAEIQYSLFGIGVEDFYMDANTGELKTASVMDREKTPGYKLIAQATDGGGLFCRSEISLTVLDVNDNAPSFFFTEFLASVFESAAPKTLLTRLQASDPDEGLNRSILYSLVDSADNFFSIDPFSGVVILEKPLDRELQDSYRLRVQAADQAGVPGSLSTQVDLTVMVLDVNDNPPVFQKQDYAVTVPEDVAVGTEVLRVFATSEDIGVNAEIYYSITTGNELGKFIIDEATGTIAVADDLDYEVCKDFFLKVEAVDGGTPPLKTSTIVTVEVMDINDNAPSFSEDIYNVLISEDAAIGEAVTRLLAEDLDSQVNGRISYSILRGDRGNQFWIDPVTGLLKVNKALDRETVSSYLLSVQAFDSGSPAMSTTVTVNIEIADVNDNAPVFSPANASAVIQLNKPAGTTILTLSVSDNDSPRNGGPFEFRIVSGNEDSAFSLDQNGELRSNRVFGPDATREYTLEIQARDSGKPQLSSSSFVFVRVIGDSLFKPVAFPLEISVVMAADVFPGGIIGRIYATDRDENDVLSFTQRPQPKSLFKINRQDGKIVALSGLESGRYFMNATVSDGRFSVTVGVTVQVEQATEEMVQNAVTLRFQDLSPEDFVGLYLQDVKRALRTALGEAGLGAGGVAQSPDPLHILGVQPVGRSSDLEVLLAVEASETPPPKKYNTALKGKCIMLYFAFRFVLFRAASLEYFHFRSCSGELDCGDRVCELSLSLEPNGLVTYSTSRVSFVSPRFTRTESCTCPGGICPSSLELCEGQACPTDMQCVRSGPTAPSVCQCLPGTLDQCTGQTSLSFAGNSYIKYRVTDSSKGQDMKLSLKIRTLQSRGVIMYTRADPCTMLKIEEGRLWFQLDCDNSLDILGISGRPINDGSWHAVTLELTCNYTLLSLDDSYVERRRAARAPVHLWPLAADGSLFFGAQVVRGPASAGGGQGPPRPRDGFQGCLGAAVLNGNELPLQNKRSRYAEVAALSEVKLGCVLYPDPCLGAPCQNGATCASLPSGAFSCSCPPQYTGARCQTEVTSCIPTPCQNGGDCKAVGNTFLCGCPRGFTGLICDEDVNECEREECENGGACVNTFGAFYCNCTTGFEGQFCGQPSSRDSSDLQAEALSYVGPGEIIGIGVLLFVVLVLLTLLAAFRKKVLRKDWARAEAVGISTETSYKGTEGIEFKAVRVSSAGLYGSEGTGGPPQVMVRPTAYTLPRCQGNPGDKAEVTGVLATLSCPPQLSTFGMDGSHILGVPRRGVAVCSVAPNLPSSLPARPAERSPLRKPPWEEEEDDEDDEDDNDENDNERAARVLDWEDRGYQADGEEMDRAQGNSLKTHTHTTHMCTRFR